MRSTFLIVALTAITTLAFVSEGRAQGPYPQGQPGQGQYVPGAFQQGGYGQGFYGRGRWFPGRRIVWAFRGGVGYGGVAAQVASDGLNVAGQTQAAVDPSIANNALPGNAAIPGSANVTGNASINGVPAVNGVVAPGVVPGNIAPSAAANTAGNVTINGVPQVNGKVNGTAAPGAIGQNQGSAIDTARISEETSRKFVEMTVVLPTADAELWFGKATTTQRGKERVFHSPSMEPGQTFTYKLRARWMDNGQAVEQERELNVRAGQCLTVTFRNAAPEIIQAPERLQSSR